jgi:hypothetical protein
MKAIISDSVDNPPDLILRSRAKHGVSKDGRRRLASDRPSRRAHRNRLLPISTPMDAEVGQARLRCALLRTRLIDGMDMIRTSETVD